MSNLLKKGISVLLTLVLLMSCIGISTSATTEAGESTEDLLSTMNLATALRATRLNTTFDYDAAIGGYQIVSSVSDSKHFMYVSDSYLSADEGYILSVDYKLKDGATDANEAVGFIIGAKNNYGIVSGVSTICDGLKGADVVKTLFTPLALYSGTVRPRLRMSTNEGTNAYDNGSTYNQAVYTDAATLNDSWNTISLYVSKNKIKNYVNGVMVWEITDVKDISGYVGLYSCFAGTAFKNFSINKADLASEAEFVIGTGGATDKNTHIGYNAETNSYPINSTVAAPKHSMFMTDVTLSAADVYRVSVEYKMEYTDANDAVGIVLGATDNTATGLVSATAYKAMFFPKAVYTSKDAETGESTSVVRPRFRISSNNNTSGKPYDNGTYNEAVWADKATVNDGWNKVTIEVTSANVKVYINDVNIWTNTKISNISGYIGLYSFWGKTTFRNFTVENISLLEQSNYALALNATSSNTTFDYDSTVGGYKIVTSATGTPKHFIYTTYKNASTSDTGEYKLSVDYKIDSADANESIGFILGATDNTATGLVSSTAYKAMFLPNAVYTSKDAETGESTSVVRPRFRISSNDKSTGNAYDNGTYNEAVWADAATLNDGWNNISVVVSTTDVKVYINDVNIWTNTKISNINGYIGLYSFLKNSSFKDFEYTIDVKGDMSDFVVSNSLRGTSENTALVYNATNDAYIWKTTASNPKHNYLMSTDYNMTAGTEYTVSVEFKGTKTDVVPQTGIVIGAESVEGIIGTDANGATVTTSEGLKSAYRGFTFFDSSTNMNCNAFRMTKCDFTTTDTDGNSVWDITKIGSVDSGKVAYYEYNENDWNKLTVKVTHSGATYYINDRYITHVEGAANAGGYIGVYSLEVNAMYRNFSVIESNVEIDSGKTVIACVGDSITQGVGASSVAQAFPFVLQNRFGADYEVINFGKSGHTAVKGYTNSYMYTQAYANSIKSNADIVVIMLGTNDANLCWSTLGTNFYETDLKEMIEAYKAMPSNPQIYLCTSPYSLKAELNTTILNELVPIQQSLASEYGCELISMYAFLEGKDTLFADELHPNSNGYSVMADKFYNAITDSVYGDVNGDKERNILDLIRMKKYVAGIEVEYIRANSDIDFDGNVSSTDLTTFRRHLLCDTEIGGNEVEATVAQLAEEMSSIG